MEQDDVKQPEEINPYARTHQAAESEVDVSDEVSIRRKYIGHETNIKSIGGLFVLFAIAIFLVGLVTESAPTQRAANFNPLYLAFWATLATAQLIAAFGLYRFQPWARMLAIPICVVWLAGIGLGTLLGLFFLYLLLSRKGAYVFSDEYKSIRKATPQVKYKMSAISMMIVVGLLLIIVAFIVWNSRRF